MAEEVLEEMTINVLVNEQSQNVTVMIPYCPECFENMMAVADAAPPPPGYEGISSPDEQYMLIGSMRFLCPDHPHQREMLSQEQIEIINRYPISRQLFKNTMRFNRKDRRKKRH